MRRARPAPGRAGIGRGAARRDVLAPSYGACALRRRPGVGRGPRTSVPCCPPAPPEHRAGRWHHEDLDFRARLRVSLGRSGPGARRDREDLRELPASGLAGQRARAPGEQRGEARSRPRAGAPSGRPGSGLPQEPPGAQGRRGHAASTVLLLPLPAWRSPAGAGTQGRREGWVFS